MHLPIQEDGYHGFPPHLGVIVQITILDGMHPTLMVIHDDEGNWMFQDGVTEPFADGASVVQHAHHVVNMDPSLARPHALPESHTAWRHSPDDSWTIEPWAYGEE